MSSLRAHRVLRIALVGGGAAALVLALARAYTRRVPAIHGATFGETAVSAASDVVAIAFAALLVVGALAVRRSGTRAGLLLFGGLALLAAAVARPIYEHLFVPDQPDYVSVLAGRRWIGRVDVTGAVAFAVGLIGLAEHTTRGRNLAVPLLALAVFAHPPLGLRHDLVEKLGDVPGTSGVWSAALVLAAIQVAFALVALAMVDVAYDSSDAPIAAARVPRGLWRRHRR